MVLARRLGSYPTVGGCATVQKVWTSQQRYCTACAIIVLLGFVALALYFDPTLRSRLNIFGTECEGASQSADLYACRLAAYTHQLAIFTAVLAVATIVLIAIGIRQASALNRAAAAAERALTDVERPWLFLEWAGVRWRGADPPPKGQPNDWFITLRFRNIGRMPALVDDCIFKIEDKVSLPRRPNYNNSSHLTLRRSIPVNEEAETQPVGPAPGRPNPLVFYGRMTYKELNGRVHHTGFALEVAPHGAGYISYNNDAYDYYD
jgi:hypothetical protein